MAELIAELERLSQLHKEGTLTDDEFTAAKAQLVQTPVQVKGTTVFVAHCPACGAGIVGTLAEQARQARGERTA